MKLSGFLTSKMHLLKRIQFLFPLLLLIIPIVFLANCKTKTITQDSQVQSIIKPSPQHLNYIYQRTKDFPINTEIAIALIQGNEKQFIGVKRTKDTIEFSKNELSIYEIGSITKVFTSTLLSEFVNKQSLSLDDPVIDYLDFPINLNERISFRHLANHSSGLPRLPDNFIIHSPDMFNPYKEYGENELKEYLSGDIKLLSIPGSKSEYSNLGTGLLGFILSQISQQSYEELLAKYIFSKYKMPHSTTHRSKINGIIIPPLDTKGNVISHWDFKALVACGGILSNVSDLSNFATAQFDTQNQVFALTQKKTIKVDENMDVGLGWHILKTKNEDQWHWHNGGTGGYSSSITLDVKNKNAVIILSNVSAFNEYSKNIDNLGFKLMKSISN